MEGNGGTGIFRGTHNLYLCDGLTLGILLDKDLSLTVDFRNKEVTEGVHAGDTHAVKTAGHLVTVLVELTAGVEHRKNNLKGASVLFFVHTRRDASAVIPYADGIIFKDLDVHVCAVAGHCLVYTVVYHLIHQMVKAALPNVTDVH